jgi:hypothetical protein
MNPRTRRHRTAWLGLFAMALIVLAPLVSQLASAHAARAGEPVAALCSALRTSADTAHHIQGDPLSACAYCDLMAGQAAVPAMPPAWLILVVVVALAAAPSLSTRHIPFLAFPSGRPRAPPRLAI